MLLIPHRWRSGYNRFTGTDRLAARTWQQRRALHTALTGKALHERRRKQGGAARAHAGNVQAATNLDEVKAPGLKANVRLEPVHPVH